MLYCVFNDNTILGISNGGDCILRIIFNGSRSEAKFLAESIAEMLWGSVSQLTEIFRQRFYGYPVNNGGRGAGAVPRGSQIRYC